MGGRQRGHEVGGGEVGALAPRDAVDPGGQPTPRVAPGQDGEVRDGVGFTTSSAPSPERRALWSATSSSAGEALHEKSSRAHVRWLSVPPVMLGP